MRNNHFQLWRRSGLLVLSFVLAQAAGTVPVKAQNPNYNRTRASAEKSRAEMEAEQIVSLSAEKIIEILRNETGLLLQVKKMLVRKAYEQGRILEPADLTDDALFRLLREDENIRILATQEIEARYYVRAKPTQAELDREMELAARRGAMTAGEASSAEQKPAGANQEDVYWAIHARDSGKYTSPAQQPATPTPPPQTPAPQIPARQLNRASLQNQGFQDRDFYDGLGIDPSRSMQRINPDQLSGLLSVGSPASLPSSIGSSARGDLASGMGQSQMSNPDLGALQQLLEPQSMGSGIVNSDLPPQVLRQQARLKDRRRNTPSSSDLDQDRPLIRRQPNPYADVPSLYDLYAQVSKRPAVLERFGMDVFRNDNGNLDDLPMDLPAGPDYVLGPGDGLNINLWGGVTQRLQRVVDREGRVALPEVGAIDVSGRNLGDVQHLVQSALRTQFRDVEADISLARIRTLRVYVVGDVENPGAYDISSLSTPLNALYAAGGPTSRGSLRHLRQFRGKQLVQEIDAYDLLLHGVHTELARLQSGDTILVPPIGPQVMIEGMVRRPAVYELDGEKSLSQILELAGGVLPSGTLRHVDVERLVAHENRTMLRLDIPETNDQQAVTKALDDFQVQDGDKVRISPILPYSDKTVYLDGHAFHPGKYPYHDGMKVTDLIHSYSDLLPEPSRRHAEIIRLEAPDFRPTVLTFNLGEAMSGKDADLVLKPFDTVRVFGRFDFEDLPVVTVSGEVRDPGDHITNGVMRLRDAVYLAGGLTHDAQTEDAQVYRKTEDGKLKVLSVNLSKALSGDPADDVLLQPKDRVLIQRNPSKVDPPTVQVHGQVLNPGRYPLGEGMTASELVHLAGGLKRSADTEQADLATYLGQDGKKSIGEHQTIEIAKAMSGIAEADPVLHDGDVLSIRQLPGWDDRGASVTLKGEVLHPGTYGIREGERLSSVLARSGGLRTDAYPYGAILERVQVREVEEKDRADLIHRVQEEGTNLKLIPEGDPSQKMAKNAALMQWQAMLEKLQDSPPSGRMVIHISSNTKQWANTSWDVELRKGDILTIPKRPNFVMVNGAVYNPTAVTFRPSKNVSWYLRQAGGPTNVGNKKSIFLVRADGSVAGGSGGLFGGGVMSAEVRPGDTLVVPEKAFSGTTRWNTIMQTSQLVSAVGIAVQVARAF